MHEKLKPSALHDPSLEVIGYSGQPQQKANQEHQAVAARAEALSKLNADVDDFKLGDLNPLIHPTDLTRKESVDAVRLTTLQKIHENGGIAPQTLESSVVFEPPDKSGVRFIARFEVEKLTEHQLTQLEDIVKSTYGPAVRTRKDSKGNKVPTENYPPTQQGEEVKSKTGGWYMGPNTTPTSALHQGLFVFKDYGPINNDNFLDDNETPRKYIVEIREANQYQTDLVTFVTQVSSVLSQEEIPDRGQLLYETYYDLIRLGLKKVERGSIYGMGKAADMIRRELITPLASPDISRSVGEDPQSVLMVGVPGTGKTLLVERLLLEDTDTFVLPIDPFALQKELSLPKEEQTLLPRIAEISRVSKKRVILHVDDIENMVGEEEHTNSTMLNLMAGVQESGFYLIASTNYPEKINSSLIQPQRFSVLIHCGLQNEEARYEILKIHTDLESKKLGKPLFASEEVRDIILKEVSAHTDSFTPRYLSNIATIAKSHLIDRVAKDKEKIVGLTEQDLEGYRFEIEDWEKALDEVSQKYDSKSVREHDERLQKFVKKHSTGAKFFSVETDRKRYFSPEVASRVLAAEAKLGQPSPE